MRETASKSALLKSGCLRWAHPAARWYQDRVEDSTKREGGKAFHYALDMHAKDIPVATPPDMVVQVNAGREYFTKVLLPRCEWIQTEVAMGINLATGDVDLPSIQDREYPSKDGYFYGTADLVCKLKSGGLLILDWKTGESEGADDQLKSLAMMARKVFPEHACLYVGVLTAAEDGKVYPWEREVSNAELDEHFLEIGAALSKSRSTSKPSLPVVGPHCTVLYCPHMAKCPATQEAMNSLEAKHDPGNALPNTQYAWEEKPDSARHAGWMALRMAAIKRALKYYDGALKDHVNAGGRAEYDGWEWKDTGNGFRIRKVR